jgi:hypothetical protein
VREGEVSWPRRPAPARARPARSTARLRPTPAATRPAALKAARASPPAPRDARGKRRPGRGRVAAPGASRIWRDRAITARRAAPGPVSRRVGAEGTVETTSRHLEYATIRGAEAPTPRSAPSAPTVSSSPQLLPPNLFFSTYSPPSPPLYPPPPQYTTLSIPPLLIPSKPSLLYSPFSPLPPQ